MENLTEKIITGELPIVTMFKDMIEDVYGTSDFNNLID